MSQKRQPVGKYLVYQHFSSVYTDIQRTSRKCFFFVNLIIKFKNFTVEDQMKEKKTIKNYLIFFVTPWFSYTYHNTNVISFKFNPIYGVDHVQNTKENFCYSCRYMLRRWTYYIRIISRWHLRSSFSLYKNERKNVFPISHRKQIKFFQKAITHLCDIVSNSGIIHILFPGKIIKILRYVWSWTFACLSRLLR